MNKKISILLCIPLVLMTVLGGCGSANKNIRMGAGDIGGIYYSFSGAFAGVFNQDNTASKIGQVRLPIFVFCQADILT